MSRVPLASLRAWPALFPSGSREMGFLSSTAPPVCVSSDSGQRWKLRPKRSRRDTLKLRGAASIRGKMRPQEVKVHVCEPKVHLPWSQPPTPGARKGHTGR